MRYQPTNYPAKLRLEMQADAWNKAKNANTDTNKSFKIVDSFNNKQVDESHTAFTFSDLEGSLQNRLGQGREIQAINTWRGDCR